MRRVLLVAAEDYSGNSPGPPYAGPLYLAAHKAAIAANGQKTAVYDIDARGRVAPSALGVLSHFKAVIWYTGDDVIVRNPDQGPGTAARLAHDEEQHLRSYLNEGGRLLMAGRNLGYGNFFGYPYTPDGTAPVALSDDFFQYWLGAATYVPGLDTPVFAGLNLTGQAPFYFGPLVPESLEGAAAPSQFTTTSSFLPVAEFPQFASYVAGTL